MNINPHAQRRHPLHPQDIDEAYEDVASWPEWDKARWWYKLGHVCVGDVLAHTPPFPLIINYLDANRDASVEDGEAYTATSKGWLTHPRRNFVRRWVAAIIDPAPVDNRAPPFAGDKHSYQIGLHPPGKISERTNEEKKDSPAVRCFPILPGWKISYRCAHPRQ